MNSVIILCAFVSILAVLAIGADIGNRWKPRIYHRRYLPAPYEQRICQIKSYGLDTIEKVQEAINKSSDGDIIRLDPIVYTGNLTMKQLNRKYVTLLGDNQCHQNTVIRGQVSIRGSNWIVNAIVFEKSAKALDVRGSSGVRLMNLVINKIDGNAIEVRNSEEVSIDNLVVDNVAKNAVNASNVEDIQVNNGVISNVAGIGLSFGNCWKVELRNNVFRNVVKEAIKTAANTNKVVIEQTVITGDSPSGAGWMSLEGNSYKVVNTVANGAPKNGIVVNGCNYLFMSNICNLFGSDGFCIYLNNKVWDCPHNIGFTNMAMGGQGLYNSN